MNYRHAYHAGNFADVLKHAVLARVIDHLKRKASPFRYIDLHAGTGLYDLTSDAAVKTGEWQDGIGQLLGAPLPVPIEETFASYFAAVRPFVKESHLTRYPGSPTIAAGLLRSSDRMLLNELHPDDHDALAALFAGDRRTKVLNLDAWTAVKALLPPPERRGVVLVDPPFEVADEFDRMIGGLRAGLERFATGQYILWYPIKAPRPVAAFREVIAGLKTDFPNVRAIDCELVLRASPDGNGNGNGNGSRLNGCGLSIINPPYRLETELQLLLPFLADRLGGGHGRFNVRALA